MNVEYVAGIDIGNAKSRGAVVIARHHGGDGFEIIRVKRLSGKKWVRNLIFRWHVLVLWFKYYRRVKVIKETSNWR